MLVNLQCEALIKESCPEGWYNNIITAIASLPYHRRRFPNTSIRPFWRLALIDIFERIRLLPLQLEIDKPGCHS